jgi:YjbE family integral membrane protein
MEVTFWLLLLQIIWIDILLSGDNALVIAMACRSLPQRQRLWGMIFGAGAAVTMRIAFTGAVGFLMSMAYLKLVGGILLLYVAVKLLVPDDDEGDGIKGADKLLTAIGTIMAADMVMSLDNIIAVAAVSHGDFVLLALGLVISIPLVVAGASMIMKLLDRFPVLVWAGSGVLGWVAGEIMATDVAVRSHLPIDASYLYAALGSILVLTVGSTWRTLKLKEA